MGPVLTLEWRLAASGSQASEFGEARGSGRTTFHSRVGGGLQSACPAAGEAAISSGLPGSGNPRLLTTA